MHWLSFLLLFFLAVPSLSQPAYLVNYPSPNKRVEVRLGESGYLVINGKTNVNKFHCYCDELSTKPLRITVNQQSDSLSVKDARLKIRTEKFDCRNNVMNKDFQQLLQSEEFPQIEIQILSLSKLPESETKLASEMHQEEFTVWVHALFTIIGNKQRYAFPVKVVNSADNTHSLQGSIDLNLLDFEITPPKKLMGLVEVEPQVTIDFFTTLEVGQLIK